jgi:hypothetical protein
VCAPDDPTWTLLRFGIVDDRADNPQRKNHVRGSTVWPSHPSATLRCSRRVLGGHLSRALTVTGLSRDGLTGAETGPRVLNLGLSQAAIGRAGGMKPATVRRRLTSVRRSQR